MATRNTLLYLATLGFLLSGADCVTTTAANAATTAAGTTPSVTNGQAGNASSANLVRATSAGPAVDSVTSDADYFDPCPICLQMLDVAVKKTESKPKGGPGYCAILEVPYTCLVERECDMAEMIIRVVNISGCHFAVELRSPCDECSRQMGEAQYKADRENLVPGSIPFCLHMMKPLFCFKVKRCSPLDGSDRLCAGVVNRCSFCAGILKEEARKAVSHPKAWPAPGACLQISKAMDCLGKYKCHGYLTANVSEVVTKTCPSVDLMMGSASRATGELGSLNLAFLVVFLAGLTSRVGI